jgi:hypothetical protein
MMAGYFVLLYGMVTFFAIIALLDWLGRRKERQSRTDERRT